MLRETIYTANVKIQGITPMLHHKPIYDSGKPGAKKADFDYSDEWRAGLYKNHDGEIALPGMIIEAMLRDAGKGIKVGKSFLTRIVPTGVSVVEFEVPILFEGKKITEKDIEKNNWLFGAFVVVKKARVWRIRAAISIGWTMEFSIEVLDRRLTKEVMQNLIEIAGYAAGLLDWRPGAPKPGKFGQFELISFD